MRFRSEDGAAGAHAALAAFFLTCLAADVPVSQTATVLAVAMER